LVRLELANMRRLLISAAIQNSNRAQNVDLKGLTAEERHATLLLLLLKFKDGFVKPYIEKCCVLEKGNNSEPAYIVHATLVCTSAIKTWTVEALDKFLIGDLGQPYDCFHMPKVFFSADDVVFMCQKCII
jgi:hypothetical protein